MTTSEVFREFFVNIAKFIVKNKKVIRAIIYTLLFILGLYLILACTDGRFGNPLDGRIVGIIFSAFGALGLFFEVYFKK